jgi:hypothetical protein
MEECVVKFQTKDRKITMYFTEDENGLEMQMAMDPEGMDVEPDLALKLASIFMQVLQGDSSNDEPEIITN